MRGKNRPKTRSGKQRDIAPTRRVFGRHDRGGRVMALNRWSRWRSFPDPKTGGYLSAPFGPGVYQLRNRKTRELVLFGESKNVAHRMSSLLPQPHGASGRNNEQKKEYVLVNLDNIVYRAKACGSEDEARNEERSMRVKGSHIFKT